MAAVGFGSDNVERGDRGSAGGRGLGSREDIGSGRVCEPVDERLPAAHEAAAGAEGLAECADADVDAVMKIGCSIGKMLHNSAALFAEDAGGVRFVDQQHYIVFFGEFGQAWKRGQVAVHAEKCVGGDQAATEVGGVLEHRFKRVAIAMWIDKAHGSRQPAAVNQTGMVLGVGENGIALTDERGNGAGVRGKTRGEHQRCFSAFKLS